MKIGIMGGTFNPIHNGHLTLAETALTQFSLDEVWFIPNGHPPHKELGISDATAKDRLNMTLLAIRENPAFRVEEYEIEKNDTSYSWSTLEHFHQIHPEHEYYFIVGADSLFAIETWSHPERIFPLCTLLAAYRDEIDTLEEMNEQIQYLKEKYHAKIEILSAPLMNVSSHDLRNALAHGKSISQYVPEAVNTYIKEEGLYGAADLHN